MTDSENSQPEQPADDSNIVPLHGDLDTTGRGRGFGKPFVKGQSGNPKGRPKGIASAVRKLMDDAAELAGKAEGSGAEVLVGFWSAVMTDPAYPVHVRLKASEMLAERGWGKAPTFAPIEEEDPLGYSEEELDEVDRVFEARIVRLALPSGAPVGPGGDVGADGAAGAGVEAAAADELAADSPAVPDSA